jgi:hypothetical protein
MFNGSRRGFGRPSAPNTLGTQQQPLPDVYQYKIDVSMDGKIYTAALDQTMNTISRNTIFNEILPVKCRFVRLTLLNWPKTAPLGIIEFTVFGKPADSLPAAVPIPTTH